MSLRCLLCIGRFLRSCLHENSHIAIIAHGSKRQFLFVFGNMLPSNPLFLNVDKYSLKFFTFGFSLTGWRLVTQNETFSLQSSINNFQNMSETVSSAGPVRRTSFDLQLLKSKTGDQYASPNSYRDISVKHLDEIWCTHSCPLRMKCNHFVDPSTFLLLPSSGQILNLYSTLVYDQIPARLMTFPSASVILCV